MVTTVHLIAAARPNFMKVAPLHRVLASQDWCDVRLVHTGQHYDANMSDAFFADLGLPAPYRHLGVGSATHAAQTAAVMMAYEQVCLEAPPDWIVVVGDVNSTLACALVGVKLGIPVAHLEAGLRSGDRSMPEEINRLVTDTICDLLWTPSEDGDENLLREGVPAERIDRVGNIMIDSYELLRERISAAAAPARLGLADSRYGVVTLHRPANVDDRTTLELLCTQLVEAARAIPLVFAVHPRTRKQLQVFGLDRLLQGAEGLELIDPLGYIDFMSLVQDAALVITDSGGVQEETTYLHIPCLTVRPNTERPVTVTLGTNRLIRPEQISDAVARVDRGDWPHGEVPPLWDGATARRVAQSLRHRCVPG